MLITGNNQIESLSYVRDIKHVPAVLTGRLIGGGIWNGTPAIRTVSVFILRFNRCIIHMASWASR